jgi:hypothetical protein
MVLWNRLRAAGTGRWIPASLANSFLSRFAPLQDLLLCAKHLFFAAMPGRGSRMSNEGVFGCADHSAEAHHGPAGLEHLIDQAGLYSGTLRLVLAVDPAKLAFSVHPHSGWCVRH